MLASAIDPAPLFWGDVDVFVTVTLPCRPCLPTVSPDPRLDSTLSDAVPHAGDVATSPAKHSIATTQPQRRVTLLPPRSIADPPCRGNREHTTWL